MIKKQNKIIVVVSPDADVRRKLIAKLAVRFGLATLPSDADKLIKPDIGNYDLPTVYLVTCLSYNFRGATTTNQRLYELAARGICIIVGVKSLPREYEIISEAYYPSDFN